MDAPSNFSFLEERFPVLAKFGEQAERYYVSDPNSCLMKAGMFGETVVKLIFDTDGIEHPFQDDAVHRIRKLQREEYITDDLADILHTLRKNRTSPCMRAMTRRRRLTGDCRSPMRSANGSTRHTGTIAISIGHSSTRWRQPFHLLRRERM
ncbi:MAG: hypothetical protein SOV43_03645 [Selenomonadaceae bacterium]|nr:hypothetical protein [Selenomonadaceae bacterium]